MDYVNVRGLGWNEREDIADHPMNEDEAQNWLAQNRQKYVIEDDDLPFIGKKQIKSISDLDWSAVKDALGHIDPESYENYMAIGMALKSSGHPEAYGIWSNWSSSSEKWNEGEAKIHWKGYDDPPVKKGQLTHRSILQKAAESGWNEVEFHFKEAMKFIDHTDSDKLSSKWLDCPNLPKLSAVDFDKIRNEVAGKTGASKRALSADAKKEKASWDEEEKKAALCEKSEQSGKELIIYDESNLPETTQQVQRYLKENSDKAGVYSYGNSLVEIYQSAPVSVAHIETKSSLGDEYPHTHYIHHHTVATLREKLLNFFEFRDPAYRSIPCPLALIQMLLDSEKAWADPITGLIEHPTMNSSGEILRVKGYDPNTGLYGSFPPRLGKDIEENPTRQDAEESLLFLKEQVFAEFAFESKVDLAVAIAMLVTCVVRPLLKICPAFLVSAKTQSEGKTTLINMCFQLIYGRSAAAAAWAKDDVEMAKRLVSILKAGHSGVLFDNLPEGGKITGDEINKVITSETYQGRILGESKEVSFPTNMMICFTGNNVTPSGDMATRVLPVLLDSGIERPDQRKFKRKNIDKWCEQNRAKVIGSILCILKAYYLHAESNVISPSRFPDWDDQVRKPLQWLGEPDVTAKFDENLSEDPRVAEQTDLLVAWQKLFCEELVTVTEIMDVINSDNVPDDEVEFKSCIKNMTYEKPTAQKVTGLLRRMKGKVLDGLRLEHQESDTKSKKSRPWRVVSKDKLGGKGERGSVLSPVESKTIYFKEKTLNNIDLSTGALETSPLPPFPPEEEDRSCFDCSNLVVKEEGEVCLHRATLITDCMANDCEDYTET